jgi:hypothetical protein
LQICTLGKHDLLFMNEHFNPWCVQVKLSHHWFSGLHGWHGVRFFANTVHIALLLLSRVMLLLCSDGKLILKISLWYNVLWGCFRLSYCSRGRCTRRQHRCLSLRSCSSNKSWIGEFIDGLVIAPMLNCFYSINRIILTIAASKTNSRVLSQSETVRYWSILLFPWSRMLLL